MSKNKEGVAERLARMQREKEEAAAKNGENDSTGLVAQLTHEDDGEPDFAEIARQMQEKNAAEPTGETKGYVKMTTYLREDLYNAYMATCTKRGDIKNNMNEAVADFVLKKSREQGIK